MIYVQFVPDHPDRMAPSRRHAALCAYHEAERGTLAGPMASRSLFAAAKGTNTMMVVAVLERSVMQTLPQVTQWTTHRLSR
jgi:hypothetical protein